MKRLALLLVTWILFAVGLVQAVPVRPLYEPEPPPKAPAPPVGLDLRGSAWLGKYTAATNRTFIFEADGTVSYKSTGVTTFKLRGKWWMDGNTLYFEHNVGANKVMDFKGTIQDQNTIVGESVNKAGVKLQQTLRRTIIGIK